MEQTKFDPFTFRAVTTEMLRLLNRTAWIKDLNAAINWEWLDELYPGRWHMVVALHEHTMRRGGPHKRHLRCQVYCSLPETPDLEPVLLDVYERDFLSLPTIDDMVKTIEETTNTPLEDW